MKKLLNKIRNTLFPNPSRNIKIEANTVPEALDFTEPKFDLLVNEMVTLIGDDNRLLDFKNYIESPMFQKFKIDFRNTNHLVLLGYAFAAAIFIKRQLQQIHASNKLLEEAADRINKASNPSSPYNRDS